MHTRAAEGNGGVGGAARHVADHATALARLELRLALLELKRKAFALAAGIGLVAFAAVLGLFLLAFLLAAAGAAWTLVLPVWAAMLVMVGCLFLVIAPLAGVGAFLLSRGTPPVPRQAIEEARRTTEALRGR